MNLKNIGILLIVFTTSGCAVRSIIMVDNARILSSLEEISAYKNKKSEIARKLPKKIGNMELHKVADFRKRYPIGVDMGYGIFYDLKQNKEGSGNIYLYKMFEKAVKDGLSEDALESMIVERNSIEKSDIKSPHYTTVSFQQIPFYKMNFVTPPDKRNKTFNCYLFITGYNSVYMKISFFYPANTSYCEAETNRFMEDFVGFIKK